MSFFFEIWTDFIESGKKEGSFITSEDGRVVFIGGPGSGAGGGGNKVDVGGIKISTQDPATMRGSQITKEQEILDKISNQLNDKMIEAGRGSETPSEWRGKSDMLSLQVNAVSDRIIRLNNEVRLRAGGRHTTLPAGVGSAPRKKA